MWRPELGLPFVWHSELGLPFVWIRKPHESDFQLKTGPDELGLPFVWLC